MKTTFLILLALVLLAIVYVRVAPSDPVHWHVDPLTAKKPKRPNAFILHPDHPKYPSPVFEMDAASLGRKLEAVILGAGNAKVLAGSAKEGFVTYVIRTKLMAYPDYASIKIVDLGDGRSTLAVFSRARFGYGDRGVNRARVLGWLKQL